MIRVGLRGSYYEGFETIEITTKSASGKWFPLSPYSLKDKKSRNMENLWQFSKFYGKIPDSIQYYSQWDRTIIWEQKAENHTGDDGEPNENYYKWVRKGIYSEYPIRYPCGFHYRSKCLYAIDNEGNKLNYIESRKKIYLPLYIKLAKRTKEFKLLKKKLEKGENILLIDIDGPKDIEYYIREHDVENDFIVNNTMLVTKKNIKIMLNDSKYSFGHCYCLALALLDKDEKWIN